MEDIKMKSGYKNDRDGYLFLAPSFIVLLVVIGFPMVFSLALSFTKWNYLDPNSTPIFVGLNNFIKTITEPDGLNSAKLTGLFVIEAVTAEMFLGIILALFLNRDFKGINITRTIIVLPFMIAEVVVALLWRYMLQIDNGIINYLLKLLNISPVVWMDQKHAFFSIVLIDIWQHTPFVILIVLAALSSIRTDLLEAAEVDGANYIQRLWYIILPLIQPQILVALVFRTTFTLRVFTQPWVLTGGGPADATMMLGIDIYRKAFRYYDMGMANSLSWIMVFATLILIIVYVFMLERKDSLS